MHAFRPVIYRRLSTNALCCACCADWQVELTSTVPVPEIGDGTISFPLENYTGTITLRYLKPSATAPTNAQQAPGAAEQNDSPASERGFKEGSAPVSLTSPPPCASSSIVTPGVSSGGNGKKALAAVSAAAANRGRAGKRGKKQEEGEEEEAVKSEAKAPTKGRTNKTPRNSHGDSPGTMQRFSRMHGL